MLRDEGPGFPFLPKGMTLKNTLLDYWRQVHKKTVSVRHRSGEDLGAMSLDAFAQLLGEEVRTKAIK